MQPINWLTDPHPYSLLYHMVGTVDDRKLRLAAVAACRQSETVMEYECCRRVLEVSERFADGRADRDELETARLACYAAREELGERSRRSRLHQ